MNTPETDKAERMAFASEYMVPTEFARELERQRDEAYQKQNETYRSSKYACDYHHELKINAEKERDEAREELRTAVQERHDFHWELQDAIRERDEAIRQRDETNESSVFSCNFYYEEKLKAERERDEAREEIDRYREKLDLLPISWDV
jgi:hypothetical protein